MFIIADIGLNFARRAFQEHHENHHQIFAGQIRGINTPNHLLHFATIRLQD